MLCTILPLRCVEAAWSWCVYNQWTKAMRPALTLSACRHGTAGEGDRRWCAERARDQDARGPSHLSVERGGDAARDSYFSRRFEVARRGAHARYDGRLVVTTRSLDRRARRAFRRHLRARLAWSAREALRAADRTRHDHRRRQSELLGVQPDTRSAPAERASAGAGREPCGG